MKDFGLLRRRTGLITLAAAGAGACLPGLAQTPRRWAIMSVLGDGLELVKASPPDASRLDRGGRETQNIPGSGFDRAALLGARAGVAKVFPPGPQHAYLPKVTFNADEQREMVELMVRGTRIPWLQEMAERDQVTHLVLVTRDKGDAMLRTVRGDPAGERAVDGVGFYVDYHTAVRSGDSPVEGFLAAFVYARATLYDVRQAKVLRHELVREGVAYARTHDGDRDPWKIMDHVQKIEMLRTMIQRNVEPAVAKLAGDP